jgi:hypothetical protein
MIKCNNERRLRTTDGIPQHFLQQLGLVPCDPNWVTELGDVKMDLNKTGKR